MASCNACHSEKPSEAFYAYDPTHCKECVKARVSENRRLNIDAVRAYDRQRASLPHRQELRRRISREWIERFPDRRKAQNKANNALRDKRLDRPSTCQGCGRKVRIESHHPDYTKPLDVVWLCKPCHAIADKARRELELA